MKNVIIVLAIFAISSMPAFSQNNGNNQSFLEVQVLINQGLDDNFYQIHEKAKNLTDTQKLFIYDDKSKGAGLPFALNLLVGFGLGSWIQGDNVGGVIGTVGGLGGVILIYSGSEYASAGALIYLGSWLIDLILPFTHASSYNSKLKAAVGLSGMGGFSLAPSIRLTPGNQLSTGISLSLDL